MESYKDTPQTPREKEELMNQFIERRQELANKHDEHVGIYENAENDVMDDVFRDSNQLFQQVHTQPNDPTPLTQEKFVIKKVEDEISKHAA